MPLASVQTSNSTNTHYSSAPLPSPTSTAPQHFYFPPSSSQWQAQSSMASQGSTSNHHLHPVSPQQQQHPQSSSQGQQDASASQGSIPPSQDPSSPLRRDFGLLAEAAKRAQIAVITRDLGDVGL